MGGGAATGGNVFLSDSGDGGGGLGGGGLGGGWCKSRRVGGDLMVVPYLTECPEVLEARYHDLVHVFRAHLAKFLAPIHAHVGDAGQSCCRALADPPHNPYSSRVDDGWALGVTNNIWLQKKTVTLILKVSPWPQSS